MTVLAMVATQGLAVTSALAAAGDLSTAAGSLGTGTATTLAVSSRGVAVSGTNLYIADMEYSLIRKVDLSTGTATVVAGNGITGYGGDGGPATDAQLNAPTDVDVDAAGNLYIADANNSRIRKVTAGGTISTIAGTGVIGSTGDGGPATSAQLAVPRAVGVDGAGNVYAVELGGAAPIRRISTTGTISTLVSGLNQPRNVAFDAANNVYVTTCGGSQVLRYPAGGGAGTVVAGTGVAGNTGDGGLATAAKLNCVIGIAISAGGVVYIAQNGTNQFRKFTVGGNISTIGGTSTAGYTGDGGAATAANIDTPTDLGVDAGGNVFFAQRNNFNGATSTTTTSAIRKISSGGTITTVVGNSWNSYSGDGGNATAAQLNDPTGVATDGSGNVYIADTNNNRIRKITGTTITTVAGNGYGTGTASLGDGGAATAGNLISPLDVAVTSTGDVIIADTGNHRVRKVSGGTITTIAGTGTAGHNGEGAATSMQLSSPSGVAVDAAGNIYIADTGNNRIRKIAGATISTIAGTGAAGSAGDGAAATAATINGPKDVTVDGLGNVFVADTGGNRVRKFTVGGTITTVAGTGTASFNGDGGDATAATLKAPTGVVTDSGGNLYVGDTGNYVVRRVDLHGIIDTVAGRGGLSGTAGDGSAGTATAARLAGPAGLAVDPTGSLYIASPAEQRVRKLSIEIQAATWWTSDATTGHTGTTYAWKFVVATATPIGKVSFTVPAAANANASALYVVTAFGVPTTGTLSLAAGVLTYTLASTVTIPAGQPGYLSVSGFTNTSTADTYNSSVTTQTAAGATIDVSQSGSIGFAAMPDSTRLPIPHASTTVTAPATTTIVVDPLVHTDVSVAADVVIKTNATYGYKLNVSGSAFSGVYGSIPAASSGIATAVASGSFPTNRVGYTVSAIGGTAVGVAQGGLAGGAYAGYTGAGEDLVVAASPTGTSGDTVTVANRVRVNWLQPAGVYSDTLTYLVTPTY